MSKKPRARDDLLLSELDGECLVYDFRTHEAHCLNATSFSVFRALDGRSTIAEIATAAGRRLGLAIEPALVHAALRDFSAAGLLSEPYTPPRAVDHARRRVLGKLALTAGASVALPAIWSIVSPTQAEAASVVMCVGSGACMMAGDCCGTPGSPAMTCNVSLTCGNNGANSFCMGKDCS